jgi:hypothetical protein
MDTYCAFDDSLASVNLDSYPYTLGGCCLVIAPLSSLW